MLTVKITNRKQYRTLAVFNKELFIQVLVDLDLLYMCKKHNGNTFILIFDTSVYRPWTKIL